MEPIWLIVSYIIPAIIVFLVMFYVIKVFLEKDYKLRLFEYRQANLRESLPVRMQAYERLTMFLERIALHNLLPRVRKSDMTAGEFRTILINNIRMEYEHNVSQQIYVSAESWAIIKTAKEEIISIVNRNAMNLPPDLPSIELHKKIIGELAETEQETAIEKALLQLKKEVMLLFEK
ncbi:MAG: hypothetical protein H7Y00_11055 [Fimbriimonadaceae bacterium]|nr:hypothetical protein [Chitinophagales bacterium]